METCRYAPSRLVLNRIKSKTDDSRLARLAIPVRNSSNLVYYADNAFSNPPEFRPQTNAAAADLPLMMQAPEVQHHLKPMVVL